MYCVRKKRARGAVTDAVGWRRVVQKKPCQFLYTRVTVHLFLPLLFIMVMVTILTSDRERFSVSAEVCQCMLLLKEGLDLEQDVVLSRINATTFQSILHFAHMYQTYPFTITKPMSPELFQTTVPSVYHDFLNLFFEKDGRPHPSLFTLMSAANFLMVQPLVDLTCAKLATLLQCKTADEVRSLLVS
jgi:S-phase kinase-associated protein 1